MGRERYEDWLREFPRGHKLVILDMDGGLRDDMMEDLVCTTLSCTTPAPPARSPPSARAHAPPMPPYLSAKWVKADPQRHPARPRGTAP